MYPIRLNARCLAALTLPAVLAACASGSAPTPGPVPDAQPVIPLSAENEGSGFRTVVRPRDTLTVSVLREPDLSPGSVVVDQDGGFMMPLIGWVDAEGKSPSQIAHDITQRLGSRYLVNPAVTVNVENYGSHLVTVEGAVASPGIFEFAGGTTLLGAVALASGPKPTVARINDIAIFRKDGDETLVAVYDLKMIRSGEAGDPLLQPGDRVVVGFSQLGEGLETFLRTVPVFGLFTRF